LKGFFTVGSTTRTTDLPSRVRGARARGAREKNTPALQHYSSLFGVLLLLLLLLLRFCVIIIYCALNHLFTVN
jgi:hypothetical protein